MEARRRNRWILWGVAGLVLVAGAWPGYRQVRLWRARGLAAEAEQLAANQETYTKGWEMAGSAYLLASQDAQVVRAMARVYGKADPGAARGIWEQAVKLSGGAREDRVGLLETALQAQQWPLAEEQLEALEAAGWGSDPEVITYRGEWLLGQGRAKECLAVLEGLVAGEDAPGKAYALYLQAGQTSGDGADRARGLELVRRLAERDDALGLEALRLLIPLRGMPEELEGRIRERLWAHPLANRADRLEWASQRLRTGAEAGAVAGEVESWFEVGKAEDLVELGRWLNQHGLAGRTAAVVPPGKALARQDLFLVWLDALALLGRWEEVRAVLEKDRVPLEEYLRHIFLSRAYRETGMERRAELGWQRVMLTIADDPAKLDYFATYARRLGMKTQAREAYARLEKQPATMRHSFLQQLSLAREDGNTGEARDVLARMAAVYPEEAAVRNDLHYLNLLLGEETEAALAEARRLTEANPQYFAHRATLALGLLRTGEAAEALELFAGMSFAVENLSDSWKTVLGLVLQANGQQAEADLLLSQVRGENLWPEERALLARGFTG